LKPNWIKGSSHSNDSVSNSRPLKNIVNKRRRGHHPVCPRFQSHTITYNGKVLCAGCIGLATGCVIAIFLMVLYIIMFPYLSLTLFVLFFSIGLIIITFSYTETVLPHRTSSGHVAGNVLLVIGLFFIVAGVFGTTKNPLLGGFAVILSFLWLDTRIQLSQWNHEKICRDCINKCKAY
jgi:MFS family permease